MCKKILCLIILISGSFNVSWASDLAIKYDFVPRNTYSYQAPDNQLQLGNYREFRSNVQVVAAKNYTEKSTFIIVSDVSRDYLETFVVGYRDQIPSFELQSKLTELQIASKIANDPLLGCAPLNINCSRTARDNKDLNVLRGPLADSKPKPALPQGRQQIPN